MKTYNDLSSGTLTILSDFDGNIDQFSCFDLLICHKIPLYVRVYPRDCSMTLKTYQEGLYYIMKILL